jgi:thiosulfate/3-mercaptopyruvate sulfurtransferase
MQHLVSTEWLEKELGAPDLRVLDARVVFRYLDDGGFELGSGRSMWQAGHIPTAAHVDVPGDLSDPAAPVPLMLAPAEAFAAAMGRAGVGDGTRAVIYDDEKHMWAARLWWMLRAYGFDDAAVLDGGFDAWTAEGRAVTTDDAPPAAARFVARPRPGTFVAKEHVLAATEDDGAVIVDALPSESYRGERQLYARAGHITGACNVPMASLVDPETGRYLAPDRLREAFRPVLDEGPRQVITYCGGGVAASSDAFALTMLGVDDVAVYDGSLLEWTADPALPMTTDEG